MDGGISPVRPSIFSGELAVKKELDKSAPTPPYCASGFRARSLSLSPPTGLTRFATVPGADRLDAAAISTKK